MTSPALPHAAHPHGSAHPRPTVLVTGAAKRIGRAIALHLGRQGYAVAAHYRGSQSEVEALVQDLMSQGIPAAAFQADLADEQACRALIPKVIAHFGSLDAVINNASVFEYDTTATFSYERLTRHICANTAPAVVLAQALSAHLATHAEGTPPRTGCVINLTDQKLFNPNPDHLSYTLSKAALDAATTALAQALAPQVRVCGIAPGITLTSGPMDAQEFQAAHRMTPLGRSSTPDDLAAAVAYLLTAPAITGTTLIVDGGQHLQAQSRDVLFLANPLKQH